MNDVQWIENLNWNYRMTFDIDSSDLLSKKEGDLVFEGLDTHADVKLNGQ